MIGVTQSGIVAVISLWATIHSSLRMTVNIGLIKLRRYQERLGFKNDWKTDLVLLLLAFLISCRVCFIHSGAYYTQYYWLISPHSRLKAFTSSSRLIYQTHQDLLHPPPCTDLFTDKLIHHSFQSFIHLSFHPSFYRSLYAFTKIFLIYITFNYTVNYIISQLN